MVRPKVGLRSILSRFRRNETGVAGVEFAITFPILLVLVAGSIDISEALFAQRKARHIVSSVAGFMADQSQWTKSEVDDLLTAGTFMIRPFRSEDLSLVVSVLEVGADGQVKVAASQAKGGNPLSVGALSPIDVPPDIRTPNADLVLAQVRFTVETPFSSLWPYYTVNSRFEFENHYFSRPRRGANITIK